MNPFKLIGPLFTVFKKGEEVKNAEVWKVGTAASNTLAGLILSALALLKAAGVDWLPEVDQSTAIVWAAGIASIWQFANATVTVATTRRIGLGGSVDPNEPTPKEK